MIENMGKGWWPIKPPASKPCMPKKKGQHKWNGEKETGDIRRYVNSYPTTAPRDMLNWRIL